VFGIYSPKLDLFYIIIKDLLVGKWIFSFESANLEFFYMCRILKENIQQHFSIPPSFHLHHFDGLV
jgi:hypothetical protein